MSFDGATNAELIEAGLYDPWELTDLPKPGDLWVSIPRFPKYQANALGEIRNSETGKVLSPATMNSGYLQLMLGRGNNVTVHSLVCEAFIGPRPDGHQVSHSNGVRTDNRPLNLRWETPASNNAKKADHGTLLRGDEHPCAKKTHCKHGHEFTHENTYRSTRQRSCRACQRAKDRKRRAK